MSKKILALDVATKTGWKTSTASGVWDLKPNRGESSGMRIVRFHSKVKELIELENIDIVAYERAGGMFKGAIIVESEMIGALILLCMKKNIEMACYSATEIKKFATGKGNAKKEAMIEAAKELGYNPKDDNEADAIHIYRLCEKDINN